jgi:hypothetical protein
VTLVDDLYFWTDNVLYWGLLALRAWAVLDCATRKTAAFPAVDKLTKPAWLAILVLGGVISFFLAPLNPISLISVVAAAVYLADVRPAVREISSG